MSRMSLIDGISGSALLFFLRRFFFPFFTLVFCVTTIYVACMFVSFLGDCYFTSKIIFFVFEFEFFAGESLDAGLLSL